MTDSSDKTDPVESQEQRQAALAPETHNDEQDDHRSQAQEVAEQARHKTTELGGSDTSHVKSGILAPDEQDVYDHMVQMEHGNKIDMSAYAGEPNHDDNVDKYGQENKLDGLRGDGS